MIRKIIQIEEEKCTGCGLCADACHEGAIVMENGKAKLIREDYCDGLGDCLPVCPADAIRMTEREAAAYDEEAVKAHMESRKQASEEYGNSCERSTKQESSGCGTLPCETPRTLESALKNWPVQIQLAPVSAEYFQNADLLIAADCTAYSYGDFHRDFMADRIALVGCPKLDPVDYSEKLTEILQRNRIRSIILARMEVPCCGGMEFAVRRAVEAAGVEIPMETAVISIGGKILERRTV